MIGRRKSGGFTAFLTGEWRGRLAIVAFLGLCAWVGFPGQASAKVTHLKEGHFGAELPWVAIDNSAGPSAGDVYGVTLFFGESLQTPVFKFEEDGTPTGVELDATETPSGSYGMVNFDTGSIATGPAVDSSAGANAGNIYVPDVINNVIDVFDESGIYVCQITGDAVPSATECAGAIGSETPSAGLEPTSVAVNPTNGDLAVGVAGGVIYEFNEAGEYAGEIADPNIFMPSSLAFDSTGALYVTNGNFFFAFNGVKFDSSGNFVSVITENAPVGVGVDLASDQVYFSYPQEGGAIEEFDSTGNLISRFGIPAVDVDVNKVSGKVYTSAIEGGVTIWSGDIHIPVVNIDAAGNIENTTATLNGNVDPDGAGDITTCEFEYGTTTAYGSSVPCSQSTPYSSPTPVSADVSGLTNSTVYHFRLKASNANDVFSYGEDEAFRTKGPTIDSESVSGIGRFTATLEAAINPHGDSTGYVFEYVTQAHFEAEGFANPQTTPSVNIGAGEVTVPVSVPVGSLLVGTKYHYRAVATNVQGVVAGVDQTFETKPIATILGQYPVAGLRSATLETEINPEGLPTTCRVQWVSEDAFAQSGWTTSNTVPCNPEALGSGGVAKEAKVELANLDLESTYRFRFIAENSSGTLVGKDKTFSTFGIEDFSVKLLNKAGEPETRAGARPYAYVTTMKLHNNFVQGERALPAGLIKDILTEAPPGLVSNPEALPKCTRRTVEEDKCTGDAQVGVLRVGVWRGNPPHIEDATEGIFNTVPQKGKAASFTTNEFESSFVGFFDMSVRGGDGPGIDSGVGNITERAVIYEFESTMWGQPADSTHDAERECAFTVGCASNADPKPFLRMPTACTGPTAIKASVNTYADPSEYSRASQELPGVTACNQLEFEPSIQARPTTNRADSPSGLHFNLHLPQNEDPEGLGTPDLKGGVVTLPEGITLNPASANGLEGCSPAQIDLHGTSRARCPEASKVGSVEVDSPLVDLSTKAGLYLATPYDNPFNSPFAFYMADPGDGALLKAALRLDVDPRSGRLTLSFDDAGQLPFNDFKVNIFSGALAPLRTPPTCGSFESSALLTPWSAPESGPPARVTDSFAINAGPNGSACISAKGSEPNTPTFSAGAEAPIAGKYSPFVLALRREDGTRRFSALGVTLPPGLLAKLAGTTSCPDAALAAAAARSGAAEKTSPSCPASSRVGTVSIAAGAGPAPLNASGAVYLTGPYKGAPLGLAVITPALGGPFDFGTVVTRVALEVDPETARISAEADPVPQMLEGIPLDVRSVTVKLDRPEFTLNPTSCDATSLEGSLTPAAGSPLALNSRFQLGDCTNLPFKPKLKAVLSGKTGRGAHPELRAELTQPPGSANIAAATLGLPSSLAIDRKNMRGVCSPAQFAAGACPAASAYGRVTATTPLLDAPLSGPIYLRSSAGKLPDLVADLRGQLHLVLAGRIDSARGRLRASFDSLPDAPISKLVLRLAGGRKGLLENAVDACRGVRNVTGSLDAHSGLVTDLRTPLKNGKCPKAKRRHPAKRPGA